MKRILLSAGLCFAAFGSAFARAPKASVDEQIDAAVGPAAQFISDIIFYEVQVTDGMGIPLILVWLLLGAVFFTVYLGFINVRGF